MQKPVKKNEVIIERFDFTKYRVKTKSIDKVPGFNALLAIAREAQRILGEPVRVRPGSINLSFPSNPEFVLKFHFRDVLIDVESLDELIEKASSYKADKSVMYGAFSGISPAFLLTEDSEEIPILKSIHTFYVKKEVVEGRENG